MSEHIPCYWPLTRRATWRDRLIALYYAIILLAGAVSTGLLAWYLDGVH